MLSDLSHVGLGSLVLLPTSFPRSSSSRRQPIFELKSDKINWHRPRMRWISVICDVYTASRPRPRCFSKVKELTTWTKLRLPPWPPAHSYPLLQSGRALRARRPPVRLQARRPAPAPLLSHRCSFQPTRHAMTQERDMQAASPNRYSLAPRPPAHRVPSADARPAFAIWVCCCAADGGNGLGCGTRGEGSGERGARHATGGMGQSRQEEVQAGCG